VNHNIKKNRLNQPEVNQENLEEQTPSKQQKLETFIAFLAKL